MSIVYLGRGKRRRKYHVREDCPQLRNEYREVAESDLKPIHDVCDVCESGEITKKTEVQRDRYCPFCNQMTADLPAHLPCEGYDG